MRAFGRDIQHVGIAPVYFGKIIYKLRVGYVVVSHFDGKSEFLKRGDVPILISARASVRIQQRITCRVGYFLSAVNAVVNAAEAFVNYVAFGVVT